MYPYQSKQIVQHLKNKYKTIWLTKRLTALEMSIEEKTLDLRISKGMDLPPYLKVGNSDKSRVLFNIHDLAYYLASDTEGSLGREERETYIYDSLIAKYKYQTIGKKELSSLLHVMPDTIGSYMKNGFIKYKKYGKSRNARVSFTLIDIAQQFANTVEVM
jgi:hypothetical protein